MSDPAFERHYRVLVLEDDASLRRTIARVLRQRGVHCVEAERGREAHRALEDEAVDLMIMDYRLSDHESGIQVYRELCAAGKRCPAILITGAGDQDILTEALRLGIRDFIPKTGSFFENLALAVERVLNDLDCERRLRAVELERLTYEATGATLAAAGISSLMWNRGTRTLLVSPGMERLLGVPPAIFRSVRAFVRAVHPEDRGRVLDAIRATRSGGRSGEMEFRFVDRQSGAAKWIRAKGRIEGDPAKGTSKLLAMLWDESERHRQQEALERAHRHSWELAERLQLSMLEIHHRVKNSFQIVSSLLNMELRRRNSLSREDTRRVIAYVQGLALIHDMLSDKAKQTPGNARLEASELIGSICESLAQNGHRSRYELSPVPLAITSRVGSSLAVITTELVINAMKHGGEGEIMVSVGPGAAAFTGVLSVSNPLRAAGEEQSSIPTPGRQTGVGATLLDFLARTDFRSEVSRTVTEDRRFEVSIPFPLTEQREEASVNGDHLAVPSPLNERLAQPVGS